MTPTPGDHHNEPSPTSRIGRRQVLATGLSGAVGTAVLLGQPSGALAVATGTRRQDVVGPWFELVVAATAPFYPPAGTQGAADRMWAISWLSALGALHAAADARSGGRERTRFEDAAVATAVHDALVALAPDSTPPLDAALAESLAAIPDGDAKQAGIAAGQAAADTTLAEREGDGFDPASVDVPYTPPPEAPGVYRVPPPSTTTLGAGLGRARPFLLDRPDRFRPGPPPALGTEAYRRDLQELQRLGGVVSERTAEQSDVARIAPPMQYIPALRALIATRRSLTWKVWLLAAYSATTVDSQIAVADGKFAHLHWRPVTAVRAADTDGDPLTDPDPTWTPYLFTPPNPDYPSGHAGYAGAAEVVLEHFCGPRTPSGFTAVIPRDGGTTASRDYPRGTPWSALTQDNVDARVWAGVHFRFSDEAGVVLGRQVGEHGLARLRRGH